MTIDEAKDLLDEVGEEGFAAHAPGMVEKLIKLWDRCSTLDFGTTFLEGTTVKTALEALESE